MFIGACEVVVIQTLIVWTLVPDNLLYGEFKLTQDYRSQTIELTPATLAKDVATSTFTNQDAVLLSSGEETGLKAAIISSSCATGL